MYLSQGKLCGSFFPLWLNIWNMAADWLGSIVSINCGESLGVYQGRVSAVDQVSQTISLTRPFHNGVKCLVPEVTFRWVNWVICISAGDFWTWGLIASAFLPDVEVCQCLKRVCDLMSSSAGGLLADFVIVGFQSVILWFEETVFPGKYVVFI